MRTAADVGRLICGCARADSDEVKEWMKELDGVDIPDFRPTLDNTCSGDPEAAAQAEERGWWTCGGYTASTDITACPDKLTWGVSFDDGPAPYSEYHPASWRLKQFAETFCTAPLVTD